MSTWSSSPPAAPPTPPDSASRTPAWRPAPQGEILVDANLATSVPHIYAIGDVTDRLNLTPVATAEGHALADTLFGNKPRSISLENVPTAVFSIPPIGTVGLTRSRGRRARPAKIFLTRFTPMRHNISGRARKTLMKLVVDAGHRQSARRAYAGRGCA